MARVKRGIMTHKRHKSILRDARGFVGGRHRLYKTAKETLMRAERYAYRDRRVRKRDFRRLWIARINAAARMHGTTYSRLIDALNKKQIGINRKVLADLASTHPEAFAEVVKFAKA